MKYFPPSLEILEQRIAPAATYSYINADGGTVKISTSKGVDADLAATLVLIGLPGGQGMALNQMNLASHPVFRGTDILFEVTGAGTADVGVIDAHGLDLGQVIVPGDLIHLFAGDTNLATPAVKELHVGSLGAQGTEPGPTINFQSILKGPLTMLKIDHDLVGSLVVQGNAFSKITSAHIHGSVAGGVPDDSGTLLVQGGIDTLLVDGDIVGGEGLHAGSITASGLIRSATITGNITGCDGIGSGVLATAGDILLLNVGGSISGEDDPGALGQNGQVRARKITTATITGAIDGGYFDFSGSVAATLSIGTINALGGLVGGHGVESGAISALTTITKAIIGSSGDTGTRIQGGDGLLSGSVHGLTLSFVEVNGDVQGGAGKVSGGISSVGSTVKVLIHGKLTGGTMDNSGSIGSGGTIGEVEVQMGIFGGDGKLSGSVAAFGKITTATIGVGLNGGVGDFSGTVGSFGNLGTVHVAGSVTGGAGDHSGGILTGSTATSIVIDGSIKGGTGAYSGVVEGRFLPSVKVGVDLLGGDALQSGTIAASGSMGTIDITGSILGYTTTSPVQPSYNSGQIASSGPVTLIHVGGDIKGGIDEGSGSIRAFSTIASIIVDGALIGGDDVLSGSIATVNMFDKPVALRPALTKVSIGGYILGGAGESSGIVQSAGSIGTLSVLGMGTAPAGSPFAPGDVAGGNGQYSGGIYSGGNMGTIAIAGGLLGNGDGSAVVYSEASIAKLTIGGSVKGNGYYGTNSDFTITPGQIVAKKILTDLEITGSVFGGVGESTGEINAGAIGSITIHGSLFGGDGQFSGSVRAFSGDLTSLKVDGTISAKGINEYQYISAQHNIGSVTAGSIVGSGAPVLIMATGQSQPKTAAAAYAIKSVTSAGLMMNTQIVAGSFGTGGNLVLRNPEASIGTVEVGTGDQANVYVGNDIAAGFTLAGSKSGLKSSFYYSCVDDVIIHGTIGQSSVPHYILGDLVHLVTVGGVPAALKAGPVNDYRLPIGANAGGVASVFASEREGP
jgi:hypothetical protein